MEHFHSCIIYHGCIIGMEDLFEEEVCLERIMIDQTQALILVSDLGVYSSVNVRG